MLSDADIPDIMRWLPYFARIQCASISRYYIIPLGSSTDSKLFNMSVGEPNILLADSRTGYVNITRVAKIFNIRSWRTTAYRQLHTKLIRLFNSYEYPVEYRALPFFDKQAFQFNPSYAVSSNNAYLSGMYIHADLLFAALSASPCVCQILGRLLVYAMTDDFFTQRSINSLIVPVSRQLSADAKNELRIIINYIEQQQKTKSKPDGNRVYSQVLFILLRMFQGECVDEDGAMYIDFRLVTTEQLSLMQNLNFGDMAVHMNIQNLCNVPADIMYRFVEDCSNQVNMSIVTVDGKDYIKVVDCIDILEDTITEYIGRYMMF